jgi:hypothetical protein
MAAMIGRLLVLLVAVAAVAGCAGSGTDWSVGPRARCVGERTDPAASTQVVLFCAQSP